MSQNAACLPYLRILEAIELVLDEELTEALGLGRYERGDARRGYRNGHQTRRINA